MRAIYFYLKPKTNSWDSEETKEKKEQQEPLLLFYYTGSTDIYQEFISNEMSRYCGIDETNYDELTHAQLEVLENSVKEDIKKNRFKN